MKVLGTTIIAELDNCDPVIINDAKQLETICVEAQKQAHQTVVKTLSYDFTPHGVSVVVILSESHIAIHTWPEYKYQSVDIYTCGEHTKPELALEYISSQLKQTHVEQINKKRGSNQ